MDRQRSVVTLFAFGIPGSERPSATRARDESLRGARAALRGSPRAVEHGRSTKRATFSQHNSLALVRYATQEPEPWSPRQRTNVRSRQRLKWGGRASIAAPSRDMIDPHNPSTAHTPSRPLRRDPARCIVPPSGIEPHECTEHRARAEQSTAWHGWKTPEYGNQPTSKGDRVARRRSHVASH